MNKLLTLLFILLCSTANADTRQHTLKINKDKHEYIEVSDSTNASMSNVEKRVRQAAVKVSRFGGGHGSGSVIDYKGMQLVLTAQHVAEADIGTLYYVENSTESLFGVLIYADAINDIALLYMPTKFTSVEPIKYSPLDSILDVGVQVLYSAYPSEHQLLSFRGRVAGYESLRGRGTQIILHTYGWFGCSGSVIYDVKGNIVGVLWGIDIEHYPGTQAVEDIIWISPIKNFNIEEGLMVICAAIEQGSKACR
tara:strand:- start:692 stop:1447 length:756 start_codon:yes stop_codon:yes gene_type:complete